MLIYNSNTTSSCLVDNRPIFPIEVDFVTKMVVVPRSQTLNDDNHVMPNSNGVVIGGLPEQHNHIIGRRLYPKDSQRDLPANM